MEMVSTKNIISSKQDNEKLFPLAPFQLKKKLLLETQVRIMLKLFCIIGVDLIHEQKHEGAKIKILAILQLCYRWLTCLLMVYFFAARVYKAAQPNVPFMLCFSETAATGCSILLRFILLWKRAALNKFFKSINFIQTNVGVSPSSTHARNEKLFFTFCFGGFLLNMLMGISNAIAELLSEKSFQMYKKSYLFSADFKNDTLLSEFANVAVFTSHLIYIINIYGVTSICILFCCFACNGISFFILSFKEKLDDNPNTMERKPLFLKVCTCHLRRIQKIVYRAECAISIPLFFLFGYLLCSAFYVVSISISE